VFPFLRLGKVLVSAPARAHLTPLADSVVSFRVWPGDLDQNRHLNNGRYLTMMDLGRFDLVSRTGLMGHLVRNRWYPVVTGATIRFRRALDAFQCYQLRTRIIAWDETGFFLEQRFERDGNIHAIAVIKGVFLGREGKVGTQRIVDLISPGTVSPVLPAWVASWERSQQELSASLKA
jgi:acyl-CoA thioesterase FadM